MFASLGLPADLRSRAFTCVETVKVFNFVTFVTRENDQSDYDERKYDCDKVKRNDRNDRQSPECLLNRQARRYYFLTPQWKKTSITTVFSMGISFFIIAAWRENYMTNQNLPFISLRCASVAAAHRLKSCCTLRMISSYI